MRKFLVAWAFAVFAALAWFSLSRFEHAGAPIPDVDAQVAPQLQDRATPATMRPPVDSAPSALGSEPDTQVTSDATYFRAVDDATGRPLVDASAVRTGRNATGPPVRADARGILALPVLRGVPPSIAAWVGGVEPRRRGDAKQPLSIAWSVESRGYASAVVLVLSGGPSAASPVDVRMFACPALTVLVQEEDGRPVSGVTVELSVGEDLVLATPGTEAEILGALGGGIRPGRSMRLIVCGGSPIDTRFWREQTVADGSCSFDCLPTHAALETVVEDRGLPVSFGPQLPPLQPAERRTEVLTLRATSSLEVELVDRDGRPASNETVWLVRADHERVLCADCVVSGMLQGVSSPSFAFVTDEAGRAHFSDVPRGDWYVGPAAANAGAALTLDPKALAPMATRVRTSCVMPNQVSIEVDRGLYTGGLVVDESGSALEKVPVRLEIEGTCRPLETTTDAEGRFVFGPVPLTGLFLSTHSDFHLPTPPISVQAGNLELRIEVAAGQGIVGCAIDARTQERLRVESGWILADDFVRQVRWDGSVDTFRFTGLERRGYALVIHAEGGRIALATDVTAPSGSVAHPIQLSAELGATVRLVGSADGPRTVNMFLGSLRLGSITVPTDESVTELLPAGRLRLEIGSPSGTVTNEVLQLSAGGARSLVLH